MSQQALIDRDVVARHNELMARYANGVVDMCSALFHIREERTFSAVGIKSYSEFCKRHGISSANGRLYANAGPVLEELRASGHAELIRHADMLKPIARMLTTKQKPETQRWVIKRQAQIVRIAAAVAEKSMVPLTSDIIADVAEKNFGWKRKREKSLFGLPSSQYFSEVRELRAAFARIANSRVDAFVMSNMLKDGEVDELFHRAFQYMRDMKDA